MQSLGYQYDCLLKFNTHGTILEVVGSDGSVLDGQPFEPKKEKKKKKAG